MTTRRQAIKLLLSISIGVSVFCGKIGAGLHLAYAKVKRIVLPKKTPMPGLISKNPAKLDTRHLDTTPMDEFDVMGQTTYSVDLEKWRLELSGAIEHPRQLTYENILKLPAIERNVLLICPGFFAYNGRWKGISSSALLSAAKLKPQVTHVEFSGPKGRGRMTKKFAIEEVMTDKIFIAHQVNGRPLPEKHGFPVRLVAEDHYGGRWVKYVDKIAVITK